MDHTWPGYDTALLCPPSPLQPSAWLSPPPCPADPDEEAEVASRLPQADDEVADTLLLMRLYSALGG